MQYTDALIQSASSVRFSRSKNQVGGAGLQWKISRGCTFVGIFKGKFHPFRNKGADSIDGKIMDTLSRKHCTYGFSQANGGFASASLSR